MFLASTLARGLRDPGALGDLVHAHLAQGHLAAKAEEAKTVLETETGKKVFQVLLLDVGDVTDVRRAVGTQTTDIDDLIMNAGGSEERLRSHSPGTV